jgi:hypothetical protein
MKDFRKLMVWQKAHEVTLKLYPITQSFPVEERYGLTSQIRRASASIGATIAEGCGKGSEVEFLPISADVEWFCKRACISSDSRARPWLLIRSAISRAFDAYRAGSKDACELD